MKGKEFTGKEIRKYLADREIYQQIARNEHKPTMLNEFIRTLKKKIYKYLLKTKTEKIH